MNCKCCEECMGFMSTITSLTKPAKSIAFRFKWRYQRLNKVDIFQLFSINCLIFILDTTPACWTMLPVNLQWEQEHETFLFVLSKRGIAFQPYFSVSFAQTFSLNNITVLIICFMVQITRRKEKYLPIPEACLRPMLRNSHISNLEIRICIPSNSTVHYSFHLTRIEQ